MKYLIFILLFASCKSSQKIRLGEGGVIVKERGPTKFHPDIFKPRTHRELHIYKYTELFVNAELAGKKDSAAYYLNIAMKYDSVYNIKRH